MDNSLYNLLHTAALAPLGMGTWNMGDSPSTRSSEIEAIRHGLDLGLKVIDTAEMYGNGNSEKLVGEAIGGRREEVYLISKVLPHNSSFESVLKSCDNSLRNLNTDYLDMYLLHWKGRYPFQETIDAFEHLVQIGKIRGWGVSNMDVMDMNEIVDCPDGIKCQTNQVLYNLSRRGIEFDLIPWHREYRKPIIAYSPIEQGRILHNPILQRIAEKHGCTPAQVALAWVLSRPQMLAIPKTSSPERMEENYRAMELKLDPEDFNLLDGEFPPPSHKVSLEVI